MLPELPAVTVTNHLANWYFGAFGNNYVDDREVKRYREYLQFSRI